MSKFIIWFFCILLTPNVFAQKTDKDKTDETVQKSTIQGHIHFLASDELRGRDTGSPELKIAAKYLATTFQRYGVQPVPGANGNGYFQHVSLKKTQPASAASLRFAEHNFEVKEDFLVLDGKNEKLEGKIVYLQNGLENDYKGKDVKGKIVFVHGGAEGNPQSMFKKIKIKKELAIQHGALAVIEFYNSRKLPWNFLKGYLHKSQVQLQEKEELELPYLWLKDMDNTLVQEIETLQGQKVSIEIEGRVVEQIQSSNIVGMVEGTDPKLKEEFIIYSAHYDHVGVGEPNAEGDSIFNGTRDNAIGTVTVLSAAENLAKFPTKRSALFILFTGEEKGLLGSKWYVEHPLLPLDKMVYCFNSDNGGYNDTSIATIIGLNRTTASDHIVKACETYALKATDDPAPEQGLFDRSDNVNFALKGIPAPTFSLGFTAFDQEIMKYYHQQSDNPDTVDYDYLYKFFRAYVYSCRLIGNDPQTPFWKKGDKYYKAGKELYNQ
ncbi:M28 family peptidase [Rapidithrix thailandica]|uniref:M28 family peptidase n=1 Tax=Rapidithrix thailandica TaxID=413964 RepID=A0AAW9S5T9_9BACT